MDQYFFGQNYKIYSEIIISQHLSFSKSFKPILSKTNKKFLSLDLVLSNFEIKENIIK